MYRIYIGNKVVANFKDTERDKVFQLVKELKKTNEDVWVELE